MAKGCKVPETIKSHKRCPQGSATGKKNTAGNPVCKGGAKPEQIQMYERCPPKGAAKSKSKKAKAPKVSAPRKPKTAPKKASSKKSKGGPSSFDMLYRHMVKPAARRERDDARRPKMHDEYYEGIGTGTPIYLGKAYDDPKVQAEVDFYQNVL